jgi:hypothetical protein
MIDACPDEMVDALTIAGSPDYFLERLREYEGYADVVKLSTPTYLVPASTSRETQNSMLAMVPATHA